MSAPQTDLDVAVIGGGITGLSAAFFLRQANPALRVRVYEGSATAGGKVAGAEVGGLSVDTGPDAFLARVPGAVDLAQALGLGDDLVAPGTGKAYVWSRGALRALPEGLVLGVPSKLVPLAKSKILSARGLFEAALDEVRSRPAPATDDPTVSSAIGRHLGREVIERLVDPLLGGINASDCDALSLASAAPNLSTAAAQPRLMRALRETNAATLRGQIGVNEARPIFYAPRTGIRTIISRLSEEVDVRKDSPIGDLTRLPSIDGAPGAWELATPEGTVTAAHVVIATPAAATAHLLATSAPKAAAELARIRTSSVALVLMAYPADAVTLPPGSGVLVPRPEKRLMTASSWWNQKWPHLDTKGQVLIRASAGRDGDDRFQSLDDAELVKGLHRDLSETLGISKQPNDTRVTRWMHGFPQYDSGHAARVERIDASVAIEAPGVVLAGASYRGIGLPACVRDAQRASKLVLDAIGATAS